MAASSPGRSPGSTSRFGFSFPTSMQQEWRPDMLAVLVSRAFMFVILYWAGGAFSQGSAPRGVVMAYGLSTILFLATWIFMPHSQDKLPARFLLFFQFLVELFAFFS